MSMRTSTYMSNGHAIIVALDGDVNLNLSDGSPLIEVPYTTVDAG